MTKIEEIVRRHAEACANEIFDSVVLPKIDTVVGGSKTTVDDKVWALVKDSFVEQFKKNFIDKINPGA